MGTESIQTLLHFSFFSQGEVLKTEISNENKYIVITNKLGH